MDLPHEYFVFQLMSINFSNVLPWTVYPGMAYSNTSCAMHRFLYTTQLAGKDNF